MRGNLSRVQIVKTGGALLALLSFVALCHAQGVKTPSAKIPDIGTAPAGASSCLGCHGPAETSLPSLAGKSAGDIETAMEQFRSGVREATLMNRIAKGFTAEESRAIAAWLAAQGNR